uniref:PX domain-containing protein n=1 Tax=Calcidiscus leptoporus TaxID=127549 RepID=A0A7S0NX90_9EUKA|mmetsp:Transcript_3748/g.8494  ORF Transcript_3748/g.8494 Transcript_3748/m.8494 type:complete len:265 (+) Transcript_3748:13-807(+)
MAVSAALTAFHTAAAEHNPFTVYVLTVKKGSTGWQVFRRYREWEDLRMKFIQQLGSSPPMPPKQLFGRMRPEVIENRVLGLNHFLQLCLTTPMYAAHPALDDFLNANKNTPPEGIDPYLLEAPLKGDVGSVGLQASAMDQQQLKDIVLAASQAFISVSQVVPTLDNAYLLERARMYASAMTTPPARLPANFKPGDRLDLSAPPAAPPSTAAVQSVMVSARELYDTPTAADAEVAAVQQIAAAASAAWAASALSTTPRVPVVLGL